MTTQTRRAPQMTEKRRPYQELLWMRIQQITSEFATVQQQGRVEGVGAAVEYLRRVRRVFKNRDYSESSDEFETLCNVVSLTLRALDPREAAEARAEYAEVVATESCEVDA